MTAAQQSAAPLANKGGSVSNYLMTMSANAGALCAKSALSVQTQMAYVQQEAMAVMKNAEQNMLKDITNFNANANYKSAMDQANSQLTTASGQLAGGAITVAGVGVTAKAMSGLGTKMNVEDGRAEMMEKAKAQMSPSGPKKLGNGTAPSNTDRCATLIEQIKTADPDIKVYKLGDKDLDTKERITKDDIQNQENAFTWAKGNSNVKENYNAALARQKNVVSGIQQERSLVSQRWQTTSQFVSTLATSTTQIGASTTFDREKAEQERHKVTDSAVQQQMGSVLQGADTMWGKASEQGSAALRNFVQGFAEVANATKVV